MLLAILITVSAILLVTAVPVLIWTCGTGIAVTAALVTGNTRWRIRTKILVAAAFALLVPAIWFASLVAVINNWPA